jgi:acetyl-CoA carboxylase/biotin carboxylase 1
MQNDHDPSRLIAETPCKLMRFLVPNGSHVDTDVPYAEVEVMKMCMPLLAPASGTIQFKMSEGSAMLVCVFQTYCSATLQSSY